MLSLPKVAEPLLSRFSIAFTKPTFQRAMVLFVGFVLTVGRRTVTRTLSTVLGLTGGHFGDYHRVFSRARWSLWKLAQVLAAAVVLELAPPGAPDNAPPVLQPPVQPQAIPLQLDKVERLEIDRPGR